MYPQREQRDRTFDVALSFAGEDRPYVEAVAESLKASDVRVFYDRFEEVDLWGRDLYDHLDLVYRQSAALCVVFVSESYASKVWTNHERRSAQARAIMGNEEYLLPARFDDTPMPGLRDTVGYVDLRNRGPNDFAAMIVRKLQSLAPLPAVSFADAIGLSGFTPESVRSLQQRHPRLNPLGSALIGVDSDDEPLWVSLTESGPVLAVAGASASGKTVFVHSLLLSLVVTHASDQLRVAILDFKGRSQYLEFLSLPHTVDVWAAHEKDSLGSMVDWFETEIRERMDTRRAGHEPPILVVAVDEFAEMGESEDEVRLQWCVEQVYRLGRHLSIAVVVASQAWWGPSRVLAAARLRVGFRFTGAEGAASSFYGAGANAVPQPELGRGWLRVGDTSGLIEFRVPTLGYDFTHARSLLRHESALRAGNSVLHDIVQATVGAAQA